jgi:glycosyltransferase involved in cell wall biosynthesis
MFFSDQITYYVVPYGLYGGGEIYIENHIKQGTFKNIHLLFIYNNPLKQRMTGVSPCTGFKNPALVEKFLISIKASCVAFHNSFQVYCMLQRVRKVTGTHIVEVIHSNLEGNDSMHCADRADIGTIIAVSDTVAQNMGLEKYEVIPPIIDKSRFNLPRRMSEKITVGTVARFAPHKNLTRIVDIAELFPAPRPGRPVPSSAKQYRRPPVTISPFRTRNTSAYRTGCDIN